jgi:hypothetical protein
MPTPWTNCSTSPGDLQYLGEPVARHPRVDALKRR